MLLYQDGIQCYIHVWVTVKIFNVRKNKEKALQYNSSTVYLGCVIKIRIFVVWIRKWSFKNFDMIIFVI